MLRRLFLVIAFIALEIAGGGVAHGASVTPTPNGPSVSPSPATGNGRISPATVVLALALIAGLYFARKRMDRGAGGR